MAVDTYTHTYIYAYMATSGWAGQQRKANRRRIPHPCMYVLRMYVCMYVGSTRFSLMQLACGGFRHTTGEQLEVR